MIPADRNLDHLQSEFRLRADALLRLALAEGHPLIVTEGWRSPERQAVLYAQGRTAPGPVVTRAKTGQSLHEYGLAVDVAWLNCENRVTWVGSWWRIGKWCRSVGLRWGGLNDQPHIQAVGWTWRQAAKQWPGGWRGWDSQEAAPRLRGKIPDKTEWDELPEGWV